MSSHRSMAMMSAPSAASSRACDRPCPRAAPVMTTTLSCTLPIRTPVHSLIAYRVAVTADSAVADTLRFQVLLESLDTVLSADTAGLVAAVRRVRPVEKAAVEHQRSDAKLISESHRPLV